MIKHGHDLSPSFTAGQILVLAFTVYANYQVLKWIFLGLKTLVTSDLLGTLIFKLTPMSVIKKREVQKMLQTHYAKQQKEKQHQEALESHRRYKAPFFNLQFIAEDRATLFKGFDDINWQEGNQKTGQTKKTWVIENQEIAFSMFSEMAAKRWELQRLGRWNPAQEAFWLKILPKRFVSKATQMTDLEKAIVDFDNDIPTKSSA